MIYNTQYTWKSASSFSLQVQNWDPLIVFFSLSLVFISNLFVFIIVDVVLMLSLTELETEADLSHILWSINSITYHRLYPKQCYCTEQTVPQTGLLY